MNKKIIMIFTALLIIVLIGGYLIIEYCKKKNQETTIEEYTPQEEITEEQDRKTIVSLYFLEKGTGEIVPEARLVDIKNFINQPYEELVKLLIEGPKNEKYEKIIPENTKLNKTYTEKDMLYLDFSSELLNYNKENTKAKQNITDSLVKTLTQLTEINSIKILIDGEENEEFNEIYSMK